jgi:hypothetical protein
MQYAIINSFMRSLILFQRFLMSRFVSVEFSLSNKLLTFVVRQNNISALVISLSSDSGIIHSSEPYHSRIYKDTIGRPF